MRDLTTKNFGLLIAYVLPGVTVLWGLGQLSDATREWLATNAAEAPTVGGFLYVTLAAVAAGIAASTVRWLVIDTIHHHTGVHRPDWNLARLGSSIAAFDVFIENHYRYHQHYANMLIAITFAYVARRVSLGLWSLPLGWADVGFVAGALLLFFASRDALGKYYERVGATLREERVNSESGK